MYVAMIVPTILLMVIRASRSCHAPPIILATYRITDLGHRDIVDVTANAYDSFIVVTSNDIPSTRSPVTLARYLEAGNEI